MSEETNVAQVQAAQAPFKPSRVKFQVGGSPQPGYGESIGESGADTLVAVDSLFGEKPKAGFRAVYAIPTALIQVLSIIALLALLRLPAQAQTGPTYQVPLNNITTTGTNVYNYPSWLSFGTNGLWSGNGGYQNTNQTSLLAQWQSSVEWPVVSYNKQTLELYVQNLQSNAQTVTVGLIASVDNAHWFLPSLASGSGPTPPNAISVSVPANSAVSTNSQMYFVTATNFDTYGDLYFAVSAVTNNTAAGTGPCTNIVSLVSHGKAGL